MYDIAPVWLAFFVLVMVLIGLGYAAFQCVKLVCVVWRRRKGGSYSLVQFKSSDDTDRKECKT